MFLRRNKAEHNFMIYLNGNYILDSDAKLEHNDRGFFA